AWEYTLDSLSRYFETALARSGVELPVVTQHPLDLMQEDLPTLAQELIGAYLESARLLGQRTAEMHLALIPKHHSPDFEPEPFTDHYRLGLFHGMTGLTARSFQLLRRKLKSLAPEAQEEAQRVLELDEQVRQRFRALRDRRVTAMRIRHHGDFHLGQVLYTGKDFIIIDFEGEPARALSERRLKRSPLRDPAGMLRSFQYAAYAALFGQVPGVTPTPESLPALEAWASFWTAWVSAVYLRGYLAVAGKAPYMPKTQDGLRVLLDAYTLEKAVYEIGYELNNRPAWVRIPLHGILKLIEAPAEKLRKE
ncbi:MAG: phosphotransferase, partial [Bryobacteraceae bacterium]